MNRFLTYLVAALAGISDAEVEVNRRGFDVKDRAVADRLESIGRHFVWGYNRALRCSDLRTLTKDLTLLPASDVGFAYEGAAMALAVRDWLAPRRRLLQSFIAGPAQRHEYMAWVGAGWALARLPRSSIRSIQRAHGLSRWMALDGYGFHEGYFRWRRFINQHQRPSHLDKSSLCVFDQGLGRSLWFTKGADPDAVASQIATFEPDRQGDLWAGVGLAAAYAGGLAAIYFPNLRQLAGTHFAHLGQGIAFASEARRRAGNPVPHTDAICSGLLGMPSIEAADLAISYRPTGDCLADYCTWRQRIQRRFASDHERSAT